MFKRMDKGVKDLLETIIHISYHMNGSIQYDDLMWRTPLERSLIEEFILERINSTNKQNKQVK